MFYKDLINSEKSLTKQKSSLSVPSVTFWNMQEIEMIDTFSFLSPIFPNN